VISMLIVLVLRSLSPSAASWLRANELIRVEADDPNAPWRLQFPFSHHNRTGFYCMCSVFLMLLLSAAEGIRGGRWTARVAWLATAAGAVGCLVFTMTRGALIGGVAGLAVWFGGTLCVRGKRKWMLGVVLLVPIGFLLLPSSHRRQLMQIASISSYRPGVETTIGARLITWRDAVGIIRERPGLGVGYGFENFERVYDERHGGSSVNVGGISHAHNQWLEIAAECGIPAAVVFGAFTILRVGVLILSWLRAVRLGSPMARVLLLLIALEVAIQLYELTNYSLRRGLGFLTYGIWACGLAIAVRQLCEPAPAITPETGADHSVPTT
jgi:O-antigen ligase